MQKKYYHILVAFLLAGISVLLTYFNPFYSIDALLCDTVYSDLSGTGDTIKLITVDEETLQAYGKFSDWSREKCAELAEYLYQDSANAPAVLAFDFTFISDSDPVTDAALTKACSNIPRVVMGTNLVYRGATKYTSDNTPYYEAWNIEMEERPYTSLDSVVSSGFTNTTISKDGFIRTTQLFTDVNGERRNSFATEIYSQYMQSQGQTPVIPDGNEHHVIAFRYSGKPGEIEHFSMKEVLDGTYPSNVFKDSIVIVGAYAPGFQDAYHCAADHRKEMYGAEINANIVLALMFDKFSESASLGIYCIILFVVFLALTLLIHRMKMFPALITDAAALILLLVIGRVLALNGTLISLLGPGITILLLIAYIIIEKYVLESIKKKRILNSFRKYMSPQVIETLSKNGEFEFKLGGEKRDVAVLFVDIRGFTSMSEVLNPEEVVSILNEYLALVTECIFKHNGMLDKYIGDAAMAVFNAPTDQDDYVFEAVCAAVDIRDGGEQLGKILEEKHGRSINFGIGVNCGEAVVGNIGCEFRMDYTAIGDTVNTSARLESRALAKEVLISEEVYHRLEGRIEADFKDEMSLKGKSKPVRVFSVKSIIPNENFKTKGEE